MDKEKLKTKLKQQTKLVGMKKRDLDEVGGKDPIKKKEYENALKTLETINLQLHPKPVKKKTTTRTSTRNTRRARRQ